MRVMGRRRTLHHGQASVDLSVTAEPVPIMRSVPCKMIKHARFGASDYSKAKNVPTKHEGEFGFGDVWTWRLSMPMGRTSCHGS